MMKGSFLPRDDIGNIHSPAHLHLFLEEHLDDLAKDLEEEYLVESTEEEEHHYPREV